MRKEKAEYQAKVIDDGGMTRSRVPHPLLRALGARPGDYMIFRLAGKREVVMRLSRARRKMKGRSKRR
jgi:hypothetical protein